MIAYAIYRINVPLYEIYIGNKDYQKSYYIFILIGVLFEFLLCAGIRLNSNIKFSISIGIFFFGILIYGLEIYLEFTEKRYVAQPREKVLEKPNGLFDSRSYKEVIEDLRGQGVNAFHNIILSEFSYSNGLKSSGGRIFPLGGISNIKTIFPNEGGYFPIIEVDEYGFNNPRGLYQNGDVDIALIGDSFTEGYSVHSNENISSVLREFGLNVINLGKSGNGPLLEYATLKEYAKKLKPKVVLWLFFRNDFPDLIREMSSPMMRKYLYDDHFSQNLMLRQGEIDQTLKELLNRKLITNNIGIYNSLYLSLFNISKLYQVRKWVRHRYPLIVGHPPPSDH
ncbi:MAG: hypothetical protein ACQ9MH_09230 [Nitrospinales bacterium]